MKFRQFFLLIMLAVCGCTEGGEPIFNTGPANPEQKAKVGLLPFGNFPAAELEQARDSLAAYYDFEFLPLPPRELPDMAWYAPRSRYRADSLLHFIYSIRPDSLERIVALTTKDISTTKGKYEDWGIMGLARLPGRAAVVSTFRIRRGIKDETHFSERFARVVKHEFGHSLGLPHCSSRECFMRDAEGKVSTVDEESSRLCSRCEKMVKKELRDQ